jgi:hypothetical protein
MIENETFKTLKNQGYHFEHNYGHGKQNLAANLALLMFLAFTVDQMMQRCWRLFGQVRGGLRTKAKLWESPGVCSRSNTSPRWKPYTVRSRSCMTFSPVDFLNRELLMR